MRLALIAFFALFCAVNLPFLSIFTSKRLGVLGLLLVCLGDLVKRRKLYFNNAAIEVVYFWLLFVLSSFIGLLISNEINSTVLAIGLTFFTIIILKLTLDNTSITSLWGFYEGWYIATILLSFVFFYQIAHIIEFDFNKLIFLRKYLLEGSFSINSTFNQIVILIFCNLFVLFHSEFSKFRRFFSLFFAFSLFSFIILSLSRQNILACLIMFSFIFYRLTSFKFKAYCSVIFIPFLLLFIITKVNVEDLSSITTRIDKTVSPVTNADYTRFKQFSDSFIAGTESPFIGIGLGSYYNYAKKLGYSEHVRVPEASINQVISEHGIIMLIIFISTLSYMYLRMQCSKANEKFQVEVYLFKSIFLAFLILLFFNEIHVQASIWILYLFFTFLKNHHIRSTV